MSFVYTTIQAPAQRLHNLRTFFLDAVRTSMATCALGACLSANAGTNGLEVTVATALPAQVSLGSPNLAAYKFTIKNSQSSGVNNVWLNANSSVLNGADSKATFLQSSFSPEVCQYDATMTQVSCQLGGIEPDASVSIVLVFNSPTQGSEIDVTSWIPAGQGGPSPVPGSNAFNLNVLKTTLVTGTTGSNGKNGNNVSTAQSYVIATNSNNNSLSAGSLSLSGATSKVILPTGEGVAIKQFVPPSSCSSMYKTCFNAQLDILDETGVVQFADRSLTLVFTRAASTLKGNSSIDNAVLQYSAVSPPQPPQWVPVVSCDEAAATEVNCYVPEIDALGIKHKGKVDSLGNYIFTWRAGQNGLRAW
jgi:hypothetical protein